MSGRAKKIAGTRPAQYQRPAGIQTMDRKLYQDLREALRRLEPSHEAPSGLRTCQAIG